MFVVNLLGRLGNQMFEYAFARYVSKKKCAMFLFDSPTTYILPAYFDISNSTILYNRIPGLRILVRNWINSKKESSKIDYTDCSNLPSKIELKNNVYYEGYFQSLKYFPICVTELQKMFVVKRNHKQKFELRYGEIFKKNNTIVLHVRRTDYLTFGSVLNFNEVDVSLPISYYTRCLELIPNLSSYKIFVIGDDREYISKNFGQYQNVIVADNEMIVDFQLMMNADVVIISNSTFAWWAALLNKKSDKKIFAPKYFLGFKEGYEFPVGIYDNTRFELIPS